MSIGSANPLLRSLSVTLRRPSAIDHLFLGRQQIDRVRFDRHSVFGPMDRHRRVASQQFEHHALEVRRQVLQDNKRHPGVGWQVAKQFLQRLQASRRRTNPNDVVRLNNGHRVVSRVFKFCRIGTKVSSSIAKSFGLFGKSRCSQYYAST